MMDRPKSPRYVVEIARRLRGGSTNAEEIIWLSLCDRRIAGAKFRRQHPLGRYIIDFYCHDARLAIELDGPIHEADAQRDYDFVRDDGIRQQGIRLLRFTNDEVAIELESVLSKIIEALETPLPKGEGHG